MQRQSAPVTTIGTNGKPTVVDFWAPWCENCKAAAPTLHKIEEEYKGKVNFVMVDADGDGAATWEMIGKFGVDAIPHLALVSSEGYVETALIGPIPASVLREDLNCLLENAANVAKAPPTESPQLDAASGIEGASESSSGAQVNKRELPYTMYDAFRTHPEDRQIHF
mmetsp:Transcript_41749/g.61304  ORF Transcript_41749/g.61304 Transcript_41749/m.61304 type:complete len:167 (+) Transcript_41749:344-844(+)